MYSRCVFSDVERTELASQFTGNIIYEAFAHASADRYQSEKGILASTDMNSISMLTHVTVMIGVEDIYNE